MRQPWPLLVLAVALACGGEGGDPASPGGTRFMVADPRGDTIVVGNRDTRAHDLFAVDVAPVGDTLVFTAWFVEPVAPYAGGASNSMRGVVDLDVDDDARTGLMAMADHFGATSRMGADWTLFLEDSLVAPADHRVPLQDLATNLVHWVPARYDRTSVTVRIPFALVGMAGGTRVQVVGVFGSRDRVSDIVPNDGALTLDLP